MANPTQETRARKPDTGENRPERPNRPESRPEMRGTQGIEEKQDIGTEYGGSGHEGRKGETGKKSGETGGKDLNEPSRSGQTYAERGQGTQIDRESRNLGEGRERNLGGQRKEGERKEEDVGGERKGDVGGERKGDVGGERKGDIGKEAKRKF